MSATGSLSIGAALFGRTRRELLGLLFTHPDRSFYLREIIRRLKVGQGSVQRDLARLVAAGLLIRTRVGSQVHYQANRGSPVFAEMRALMIKSTGVGEVLRRALEPLAGRIEAAFVYGSLARGEFGAGSDVDLMVIGEVAFREVVGALQAAQKTLEREVNPSVFSPREFGQKVRAGHHFLGSVMKGQKFFVIGDPNELGRLAESKLADPA